LIFIFIFLIVLLNFIISILVAENFIPLFNVSSILIFNTLVIVASAFLSGMLALILDKILKEGQPKKIGYVCIGFSVLFVIFIFASDGLPVQTIWFSNLSSYLTFWLILSTKFNSLVAFPKRNTGPWEKNFEYTSENFETLSSYQENIGNPRDKKLKTYKIITVYSGVFKLNIVIILLLGLFYYPLLRDLIILDKYDFKEGIFFDFSYNRIQFFENYIQNLYTTLNSYIANLSNLNLIIFLIGLILLIIFLVRELLKKNHFRKQYLKKFLILFFILFLIFFSFNLYVQIQSNLI